MATKKFTKEEALKFMQNFNEYSKYLWGSRKLNFKHPHDFDYTIIVDNITAKKFNLEYESIHIDNRAENKPNVDYFIYSESMLKKILTFKLCDYTAEYYVALYLFDKNISPELPFKYDLLKFKNKLIELLKIRFDYYIKKYSKVLFTTASKYNCLPKSIYPIVYLLFCILDNSVIISKEHYNICEKIHDRKMPLEYLKTIKKLIDQL